MLRKKEGCGSACGSSGACGRLYRAQSLQYPVCGTCPYAGLTEQSANCTLYELRFPTDLQSPHPAAASILTGRPRGRFCSGSVGVSTSISVEASVVECDLVLLHLVIPSFPLAASLKVLGAQYSIHA